MLRGRDGTLRAFRNVCRHRGARLLAEGANPGATVLPLGTVRIPGRTPVLMVDVLRYVDDLDLAGVAAARVSASVPSPPGPISSR